MRLPTIVVLAVDGMDSDDIEILNTLAGLADRPATLLIGSVHDRILASAGRAAESRGLRVVGTATRPLDLAATERLLAAHLSNAPPIERWELEQALGQFEMSLQYQPMVGIRSEVPAIDAVEALVRWHHPRRGVLHPRYFLGAVEDHGSMTRLTHYVITEAVRQAGRWRERGLTPGMIVNLSPRLVRDRAFPDRLVTLLRENAVPPASSCWTSPKPPRPVSVSLKPRMHRLRLARCKMVGWARRLWSVGGLAFPLQRCVRRFGKSAAWCAYAEDDRLHFGIGRMRLPAGSGGGAAVIEAYFLEGHSARLGRAVWMQHLSVVTEEGDLVYSTESQTADQPATVTWLTRLDPRPVAGSGGRPHHD